MDAALDLIKSHQHELETLLGKYKSAVPQLPTTTPQQRRAAVNEGLEHIDEEVDTLHSRLRQFGGAFHKAKAAIARRVRRG